jgi:hypothetical protein
VITIDKPRLARNAQYLSLKSNNPSHLSHFPINARDNSLYRKTPSSGGFSNRISKGMFGLRHGCPVGGRMRVTTAHG